LKSYYYSLINKTGSKHALKEENVIQFTPPIELIEEDCESCKL
jgi:hypothetical protein